MKASPILLIVPDSDSRAAFADALRTRLPAFPIQAVPDFEQARELEAAGTFGAAVCVVDTPEDLSFVVRLKKSAPHLPVVLLTSIVDAAFSTLARQAGADRVIARSGRSVDLVAQALKSHVLASENRRTTARTRKLGEDLDRLMRESMDLLSVGLGHAARRAPGAGAEFLALIVEDDTSDLLLITRALMKSGEPCSVRGVLDVMDAQAYLEGRGKFADRAAYPIPSVIVSDFNLPGPTGFELLRWLRAHPTHGALPFVLLTGSSKEELAIQVRELGADFFVQKSADYGDVVRCVRSVREERRKGRSDGAPPTGV